MTIYSLDSNMFSEKIQRKKNSKREAESTSLDSSCFVANVPPSSLRYDRMVYTTLTLNLNEETLILVSEIHVVL